MSGVSVSQLERFFAEDNRASLGVRSGFTLIELLLVIVVLAILAGMLFPALSQAKMRARSIRCKSNLHQISLAAHLYADDYRQKYPYHPYYLRNGDAASGVPWWRSLKPYYLIEWTNAAYHCPEYKGLVLDHEIGSYTGAYGVGSYGYNVNGTYLFGSGGGLTPQNALLGLGPLYDTPGNSVFAQDSGLPAISESSVKVPSQMFAFGDARMRNDWVPNVQVLGGSDMLFCGLPPKQPYPCTPRHGKRYNVVCCDQHVEGIEWGIMFDYNRSASRWNNDYEPHPETWP